MEKNRGKHGISYNKQGKWIMFGQVLVKEEKQVFSFLLRIWLKNYMLV